MKVDVDSIWAGTCDRVADKYAEIGDFARACVWREKAARARSPHSPTPTTYPLLQIQA